MLRPSNASAARAASNRSPRAARIPQRCVSEQLVIPMKQEPRVFTYQKLLRQYECIGRFVEAFEEMVHETRQACINLLSANTQIAPLISIPFYHDAMTAKPLFDIFRGITAQMLADEKVRKLHKIDDDDHEGFLEVLARIAGEYGDLVGMRNHMLHGTWQIGQYDKDDETVEFSLLRRKITKHGLAVPSDLPKNVADVTALVERCKEAKMWISILNGCNPLGLQKLKFKKCFRQNGDGWERIWPNPGRLPRRRP
jgi:hypothetical protein